MPDDPRDPEIARALDAWVPLAPPAEFADRVVAARDAAAPPAPSHRRMRWLAGLAVAGASAAAVAAVMLRSPHHAATGTVFAAQRTTAALGDRGVAVAEAASELTWRVADSGAADITQRTGNVFYRVERGGAFVVHTPAGDVRVTGTCFRIEVEPMTPNQKLALAGAIGAALASAVLVTVYEGHVIAETRSGKTELAAGSQTTLRGDATLAAGALATPIGDSRATREQLIEQSRALHAHLDQLRSRIAELERAHAGAPDRNPKEGDADAEPGRPWYDPSLETLAAWAANCHIRADEPSLDHFTGLTGPDERLGVTAGEVNDYNAAMSEVQKRWKDLVRGLYLETTGDTAGADTLSNEAMRREIDDKSPRGEHNQILQRIARERAGLAAPPADLSKTSTLERMTRAYTQLGSQAEAALARRLGPERAHAIRGDGWSSRSDSSGCPDSK